MDKTDFHNELIQDIWNLVFSNRYLGIRRMKRIFTVILKDLSIEIPDDEGAAANHPFDYSRYHHNEWLKTPDIELYKSSNGKLILTIINHIRNGHNSVTTHHYDLDLHETWSSINRDVCLKYANQYKQDYSEKLGEYTMQNTIKRLAAQKERNL